MTDLKPCAHCGGRARLSKLLSREGELRGDAPSWDVECESCWVWGRWKSEDQAVQSWNRRAPEAGGVPVAWRCFHCDEVFTDRRCAALHFGADETAEPACKIKGSEGGLVEALRRAEKDAGDARFMIHNEATDAAKAYHAQNGRHVEQMRALEQAGYDRGIADAKAHPETLGLYASPVLPDREEVARVIQDHVKVDAIGTSPAVAGFYMVGFDAAADAILAILSPTTEGGEDE